MAAMVDPIGWLVLIGAGLHAIGGAFRDQIVLRTILLAGSFHYLAYYFAVTDDPLWPAILGTGATMCGNTVGLVRVILARRRDRRVPA